MSSADEHPTPPPRTARLVLVAPDGQPVGQLPPVPVSTPWWQDIKPVVEAVRQRYGLDVTILRLLEAERGRPHGGGVTYLAEVDGPVAAEPWPGRLDDHPLRLPYARPGGPAADLAWASAILRRHGLTVSGRPVQVRSWNLSSLWRLPVEGGAAWLKVVPPFFVHEGDILAALADCPVPRLLGHDGNRILLVESPGEDLYEAGLTQLKTMVALLVALQRDWIGRVDELLALGLPDWRSPGLAHAIATAIARSADDISAEDRQTLARFVDGLPDRLAAIEACGLGPTLIHGDFHPGNLRGDGDTLILLDWGDSGVGHPLLDQPAFLEVLSEATATTIRGHWNRQWQAAVPGSNPGRAARLLAPVAAALRANSYRVFLDNIEPSEHPYHRSDTPDWLHRTAVLIRADDNRPETP